MLTGLLPRTRGHNRRRLFLLARHWPRTTAGRTSSSSSSDVEDGRVRRSNPSVLSKEAATSPADFVPSSSNSDNNPSHRFLIALPPAMAIHLSIGPVYAYGMWTSGMSRTLGVVVSAPNDWTQIDLLPVFSTAAVILGITTSALGGWVEKVGPRIAGMVGSAFWSCGLLTTSIGIEAHSLPLVYLGYGAMGGVGWGLMYLTPVTSAMKWFPDRRGLATGIALSAFGAGAALAPGIIHALVDYFAVAPEYVGFFRPPSMIGGCDDDLAAMAVELATLPDGSLVVASTSPIGTPGTPVVVATSTDIARCTDPALVASGPGAYAIGTGDAGVAKAMASMGALCGAIGAVGSRYMRIPHPDWKPPGRCASDDEVGTTDRPTTVSVPPSGSSSCDRRSDDVGLSASYVITGTRQFPLLWLSVFGNATGGLALLSSSKLMLTDIFAGVAPEIVTPAFSTGYVSALGAGMALGRFGWSAISDVLGRRRTYALFGLGMPIVGMAPYLCHAAVDLASRGGGGGGEENVLPYLMTFYGGSVLAITFYGGIFSVLPAYIADLFGQKHAGAIHGKALTAWAASAVAGPVGLAYLRSYSYDNAMSDLLLKVEAHDATALERTFGVSIADEEAIRILTEAKTLTIEKLLELSPAGTVDPTPFLYDTTCYLAAGLMGVAALSNLAIRPLDLSKELQNMEKDDKDK